MRIKFPNTFFYLLLALVATLLISCAHKPIRSYEVAFREPETFAEKTFYNVTKGATITWIHPGTSPTLMNLTGYKRLKDLGKEFLVDIDGEKVCIEADDGAYIEGMYFDPNTYRSRQTEVYKKWRKLFAVPKNCKLAQIFEVDFISNTLSSFFSFPRNVRPFSIAKRRPVGVLCLPACGLIYELDPKYILTFLRRGMHVLIINYRGILPSEGVPNWKGTSLDAANALYWFKRHLAAENEDLVVIGKSFGSGPAVFAGTQCQGVNLIIDRGFARMSDVCEYSLPRPLKYLLSPMAKSLVEKFYRFPNEDWISQVKGKVLIVEAVEDDYMQGQAEKLFDSYCVGKTEEEKDVIRNSTWIQVPGGHYGKFWGDAMQSWYSDEKSQEKITKFLNEALSPASD